MIANPRQVSWGTTPVLVQSTTTPGQITIKASMLFEGTLRPIAGEITINSVATEDVLLFDPSELEAKNDGQLSSTDKSSNPVNQKLKEELKKVKMELNDMKLKQVEKQQSDFGEKSKEN